MNKKELLIIGQSKISFETLNNLFNKNDDWRIITAIGDEEAIEKFHRHDFEVAVFTDSVSSDEERKLRKIFRFHNPDIIIVRHQHDDEDLLIAEIMTALDKLHKSKKPSYSLVDDALKNAGLHINIQ